MHDSHGRVGRQALQQRVLQGCCAPHAHVNHQGQFGLMSRLGQSDPVHTFRRPQLGMAGDEHHAMRVVAVRQGHAQRGDACQARGDAVDHGHRHALGLQMFQLFAATPKNKGVSPFEAHHVFTCLRLLHHQFFDESLRRGCAAPALAHVDDARRGRGVCGDGIAHQIVDQQNGG